MNRATVWAATVLMVVGTAVACGQSNTPPDRGQGAPAATLDPATPVPSGPVITIEGMGFSALGPVAPGTQITIINNDEVEHSVTSRTKGVFDVHVDGKSRATLTVPQEPGDYAFYCLYHPAMLGTLTVK